jgi:hypothetical protein
MSSSPSPKFHRFGLLKLLMLLLPLVALAVLVACGGASSSGNFRGGGGSHATCVQTPAVTVGASTKKGVGLQGSATFMDLHLGTTNLPWPTVPFGGLRLWDSRTGWAEINTAKGTYDWSNLDNFAADAQAHNVDLLYNLARTPHWASSSPNDSTCAYASIGGGNGQCWAPIDLNSDGSGTDQTWIDWVTAVSTRYKGRIKYYEIWNEWNVELFWRGTPQQLVRMEQDARCVVKGPPAGKACNSNSSFPSGTGLDPNASIVTPAPVSAHTHLDSVASNLSTYFQTQVGGNAGGAFADVIGFHAYVGTLPDSGLCPTPEDVNTVVDDLNNTVASFPAQQGKPWFNTEGGWSKADEEGFLDPDRQAAFLARYFLLQRSLGVERVYWYRWDSPSDVSLWITPSGPISEAGTAYGEVSRWIVGATLSGACTPNQAVWSCKLTRSSPSGYQALAVWDTSQDCLAGKCTTSNFAIPAGATYTEYRDVAGNVTNIGGVATVPIGAKPILLETAPLP